MLRVGGTCGRMTYSRDIRKKNKLYGDETYRRETMQKKRIYVGGGGYIKGRDTEEGHTKEIHT